MSKRGPRFSEKEKLAVLREGEKNGVRAVCEKYGISDHTYRLWRYKALGIRPRKQRSRTEKLRILEDGYQNGIKQACAAHGIDSTQYFRWKKKLGYSKCRGRGKRKRFTKEQILAMAREAEKTSTKAVCEKYKINYSYFSSLRTELTGIRLARRFSPQEKLRILEEGYQSGVCRVCAAYQIDPTNYYNWKKQFGFSKSRPRTGRPRRFTKEQMLAIVKEAERTSSKAVREKYGISPSYYSTLRYQVTGVRLKKSFSPEEKLKILEEGYRKGILRTCNDYGIDKTSYYHWKSKFKFDKSLRCSFSEEERLQIVNEAIRDGIIKAGDRHHVSEGTIRRWAKGIGREIPWRTRYNIQEKHAIIKEALRNGVIVTCRAYEIDPGTLRYWRRKLGL